MIRTNSAAHTTTVASASRLTTSALIGPSTRCRSPRAFHEKSDHFSPGTSGLSLHHPARQDSQPPEFPLHLRCPNIVSKRPLLGIARSVSLSPRFQRISFTHNALGFFPPLLRAHEGHLVPMPQSFLQQTHGSSGGDGRALSLAR